MKITGSKAHRVWKCPPSAVLPQTERDQSKHEPARDRGKAIHSFLEHVKTAGRSAALADAPAELRPVLEALDLANLPVHLAAEVAFAWNWKTSTARELGRGIGRNYELAEPPVDWSCETPLTLDVVGVEQRAAPRGYVGDYKSGHSKYPPPDQFAQTLLGAACVRSLWGCETVVVELLQIHDNGSHHVVRRTVDEWELDAFELSWTAAMGRVAAADLEGWPNALEERPEPHEGTWCEWCDAYKSCPAKIALVRSLPEKLYELGVRPGTIPGKDGVEQHGLVLTPGVLTVRNAAAAWMVLELIDDVVGRAKAEICNLGAFEEIPLPDGRVIGLVHTEKRALNGRIAAEVLEKRFGREERDKRVSLSVTMDALYKAAVANKKEGEKLETKDGTGIYDRLLQDVERLGGLEIKTSDAVRPHLPRKKRLPAG